MKKTNATRKRIISVLALVCLILSFTSILHAELFLWEVQKGDNTAYLLGSFHLMPKSVYPLDEKIESSFDKSDVLVVEVDATVMDQNAVNAFIGQYAVYQDTLTLSQELPPELYASIAEKFIEMGYTEAQLNKLKPWFVSLNLGLSSLQQLDVDAGLGIDVYFLNKAHERGMNILELETSTSQLEMLASFPQDIQVDYLQYSLDKYTEADSTFYEMLDAWQTGDTERTNKLSRLKMLELEDEMPGMAEYYDRMFCQREEEMVKKIDGYMNDEDDHTYFIIVGAFHMVGEDGLIRRLEANGYTITQQKETKHEEK
ncbi:MAG: TraB/GumN family protein [Candidatus Cloacimonetes bacterium]|nr:TraB/GumN family protein [Candidatus Cloacimonadota bacterium]